MSVSLSIVSHGQLHLIRNLLGDLRAQSLHVDEIILTINIPEDEAVLGEFIDLPLKIIHNPVPKGFGANHNQAFQQARSDVFIIVNPDIRIVKLDLDALCSVLARPDVGACAPVVLASSGKVEDSVRRFPTLSGLFSRVVLRQRAPDWTWTTEPIEVEWAAGMFVAFQSKAFEQVHGFDERLFMYLEHAELFRRLKQIGLRPDSPHRRASGP